MQKEKIEQGYEYLNMLENVKKKYENLNIIITRLEDYKCSILNIDYSLNDRNIEMIDKIYAKIGQLIKFKSYLSTLKFNVDNTIDVKFRMLYSTEIDFICSYTINELKDFYNEIAKDNENNERLIYELKVIVAGTLDKILLNFYEAREIEKQIFEIYKNKYKQLKLEKPLDKELIVENLQDTDELVQ